MKKMMIAMMAMLTIAAKATAMSYEQARNEALFLTDKMAYELNLTDDQYEACYEINLDYLMGVTSRHDVYGPYWERRNLDLSYVLYSWQWELVRAASYFYRPLYWEAGYWHFGIYLRYPHRDYFYFGRPHFYASYRGGHSWHRNNGHSFYEHRVDHYRPNPHAGRDHHVGMRNSYDRGDYRTGGRGGSSTRYNGNHNRGNDRNDRNGYNRGNGGNDRNNHGHGGNGSNDRPNVDNNHNGNHSHNADNGGGSSTPSRNFGGNRSGNRGSANTTPSTPTRNYGGSNTPSRNSGSMTRGSSAPSRNSGSSMSRGSSAPSRSGGSSAGRSGGSSSGRSGGGHFGGSRR